MSETESDSGLTAVDDLTLLRKTSGGDLQAFLTRWHAGSFTTCEIGQDMFDPVRLSCLGGSRFKLVTEGMCNQLARR